MLGRLFGNAKPSEFAEETLIARLNARMQPIGRSDYFEDPLNEMLQGFDLGEVTGGGAQLTLEPAGVEFYDIEIRVNAASDQTFRAITDSLDSLGAPKGSKLITQRSGREIFFGVHEGIGIFLNGTDLPDTVYEECDITFVMEEFNRLLGVTGALRGSWQGAQETALYCYGPSAKEMKASLAPFLASYPLCERARIEQIA
jgi:hypothetical protein